MASFANNLFAIIFHTVPSEPLNVDVLSIAGSPTELLVSWDPPAEPNGIILSYTVYCYDLPVEEYQLLSNVIITSQPEHKKMPGNETEIVLVNLTPYYLYSCLVTANTSVGEGNASSIHFNITDESGKHYSYNFMSQFRIYPLILTLWFSLTVPADPPANFSAAAINSTTIELTWSQPPTPNGIVIFYNLTYNLSEMIFESSFSVLNSVLVGAEDKNSYVVTGLNEYTIYQFEIFASTRIGPGPSTQATARTHATSKPGIDTSKMKLHLPTLSSIDIHVDSLQFTILIQIHMLHLRTFRAVLQAAKQQLLVGILLLLMITMASSLTTCC